MHLVTASCKDLKNCYTLLVIDWKLKKKNPKILNFLIIYLNLDPNYTGIKSLNNGDTYIYNDENRKYLYFTILRISVENVLS